MRTQRYVELLAKTLIDHPRFRAHLNESDIALLFKSAPLHDIGKVGVPDRILLKQAPLSAEEFAVMKRHTFYGYDALLKAEGKFCTDLSSSFLRYAREIALNHHEKWDGSGYPRSLEGEGIPLAGRLMAVADVYDAMISKRVYKPAFPHEKAVSIILSSAGTHFDPDIVVAFHSLEAEFRRIAESICESG